MILNPGRISNSAVCIETFFLGCGALASSLPACFLPPPFPALSLPQDLIRSGSVSGCVRTAAFGKRLGTATARALALGRAVHLAPGLC